MRKPRGQGSSDIDGIASNYDQSEKQSPLIPKEYGAIVGAAITAAASLLIYSFQQVKNIDTRLDQLEQEARVLLDGSNNIKPSSQALEAKYHLEALERRVNRLEDHFNEH